MKYKIPTIHERAALQKMTGAWRRQDNIQASEDIMNTLAAKGWAEAWVDVENRRRLWRLTTAGREARARFAAEEMVREKVELTFSAPRR
jgi:DNA-binding PadR family transcriptional regulator